MLYQDRPSGLILPKKPSYRYLVFVDFDGVLTSGRVHFTHPKDSYAMWATFDPVVMEFFNKIHNTFVDVGFVWSTTWRNGVQDDGHHLSHILYSMWYNAGFRGHFGDPWRLNPDNDASLINKRAQEIQVYLQKYGSDVKDYLILDDSDYGFNDVLGKKRFVKTDPDNGMLFRHMKDAWSLMGNWDKK